MDVIICFRKCVVSTSRSSVVNRLLILLLIASCLIHCLKSMPLEPSMEDLKKKECPPEQPILCIPFGACCSYFQFCYSGMCESCFFDDDETAILKFCREGGLHNVSLMRHYSCQFACRSRFTDQELGFAQTTDSGLIDVDKADKDIPKAGNLNKESLEKEDTTTHKLLVALIVMTAFIILAIIWICIPKHAKKGLWLFLRTCRKKGREGANEPVHTNQPDENSDVAETSNVDSSNKRILSSVNLSGAEPIDVSPSDVNSSEGNAYEQMTADPNLRNPKYNDVKPCDDETQSLAEQSVIKQTSVNHPDDKQTVSKQDGVTQCAHNHLGTEDNLTTEKHFKNSEKEEKTLGNTSIRQEVPTASEPAVDTAVRKEIERNILKNEASKLVSSFSTDNQTNKSMQYNFVEKPLLTNEIKYEQEDDKTEDDEKVPLIGTKEGNPFDLLAAEDVGSSAQDINKKRNLTLNDISRQNDEIADSITIRKNGRTKPLSVTDETIKFGDKDIEHTADCCTQRSDAACACSCVKKGTYI